MASPRFSASQVCYIVSGDHGDMDFIYPGSDVELKMGERNMETTDFLDRGGVNDEESDASADDMDKRLGERW